MKYLNIYVAITLIAFAGYFSINKQKTSPRDLIRPGFHEFNPDNFSLKIKENRNQLREKIEKNEIADIFSVKSYTSDSLEYNNESSIRYLFARPENIIKNLKYPLVLYIHGSGDINDSLPNQQGFIKILGQEEFRKKYPCFLVSPRFSQRLVNYVDPPEDDYPYKVPSPTPMLDILLALMDDLIVNYPVDTTRIYVGGHSHGSSSIHAILKERPGFIAAASQAAGNAIVFDAKIVAQKTSLWNFIGKSDKTSPPLPHTWSFDSLQHYGANNNIIWYMEDCDHAATYYFQNTTLELIEWMFNINRD
jgi:predicted peptidase